MRISLRMSNFFLKYLSQNGIWCSLKRLLLYTFAIGILSWAHVDRERKTIKIWSVNLTKHLPPALRNFVDFRLKLIRYETNELLKAATRELIICQCISRSILEINQKGFKIFCCTNWFCFVDSENKHTIDSRAFKRSTKWCEFYFYFT